MHAPDGRVRAAHARRWRSLAVGAVALAAASLSACATGGADSSPSAATPSALAGKTYISDDATNRGIPGGGPLVLSFTARDSGGTGLDMSANAGCNGHGGAVTFDGGAMTAGPLMGTMMACPPPRDTVDKWVAELFGDPLEWNLSGRTLTLSRGDIEVTLDQRVDRAVAGTTWRVTGLVRDHGVQRSTELDRVKPTITIGAEGTLRGWTGCNSMNGEASVVRDGSSQVVETGIITTTRKACGPAVADIERAVLSVLEGGATAEVHGDELRLTNRNDPALGLRLVATRTK